MKYILLFISLLSTSLCVSQSGGATRSSSIQGYNTGLIATSDRYGSTQHKGYISYEEVIKEYQEIGGSPYLYGKEIVVDIISKSDSLIYNVPIKYDLYNNEVIAKTAEGKTIILDQDYYKGFIYKNGDQKETFLRLKGKDDTFYIILFKTDNFVFYKTNNTRIVKTERHIPGVESIQKKFAHTFDYYIMDKNGTKPVKLRKEEAMQYFPKEYRDQIPAIKKELKIKKIRKEKDYIKVINEFKIPKTIKA